MLIFKGLKFPPHQQIGEKSPAPSYLCARHKIWKLGFAYYIKGFTERPHFAVVGRWDVLAHMCHLRLSDSKRSSGLSPPSKQWSCHCFGISSMISLSKRPRGSHGQGYVGAFIPCKVAPTMYFHSHLPSMASFPHHPVPPAPAQAPMGWVTRGLIWLKIKPTRKDHFGPEEDPASLCFTKKRQFV